MTIYTKAQQEVIDRYLEATKNNPDCRISIDKLIGMKKRIPKYRPDNSFLKLIEDTRLNEDDFELVKAGRPKTVVDNNRVFNFLSPYVDRYDLAKKEFYWLDDIVVGVTRLDLGGNTRDLSVYLLFDVLSICAMIDVDILKEYCEVADRQAQKILKALVVANRMIEKEIVCRELENVCVQDDFAVELCAGAD